jgi:chemotaxis response regulator CheB
MTQKTARIQPSSPASSPEPTPKDPEVRTNDIARDVILIGASAGGIQAVGKLLSELPHGFKARIGVTLHRSLTIDHFFLGPPDARGPGRVG